MSVEEGRQDATDRPITELDRIRDIIFGPQMQDYRGQFSRVAAELGLLSQQLDELRTTLAQQQADQSKRHDELDRTFSERLDQLESSLRLEFTEALDALQDDKASRLDMGDILLEMGGRLKQQFRVADLLGPLDDSAGSDLSD
jgi:hypothetical protein